MQTIDLRLRISLAALAAFSLVAALLVAAPSAQADSLSREVHNAQDFDQAITEFNIEADDAAHHTITIMNDFTWDESYVAYAGQAELTIQGADPEDPPTVTLGPNADGFLFVAQYGAGNITIKDLAFVGGQHVMDAGLMTVHAGDVWLTDISVTGIHADNTPISVLGGAVTVSGATFTDNSSTEELAAGALDILADSNIAIYDSTFVGNEAQGGDGGAVRLLNGGNSDTSISDSVFTGNVAAGRGGAVWELVEDVIITRSAFTENQAGIDAGAVGGPERVSITDSTFIDNTAADGDGGAVFAGIYFDVVRSTFSGNSSGDDGGALYSGGGSGSVIQHSTFELNTATTRGGAVYTGDNYLAVQMSTLVSNSAPQGAHAYISISTFNMYSSVFADAREGDGCHVSSFANGGYNFDDDGTCTNSLAFGPGLDPLLLPLADNGGYTPTRMPAPGSPLLDRIEAELCALHIDSQFFAATPYDQRGLDILDVLNRGDAGCDTGAVERVGSVSFTLPGLAGDIHFTVDGALAHYGECDDVAPISEGPAGAPAGVALPHGLLSFCVDTGVRGAAVTVTVTFPSPVNRAYKVDDAWLELPGATFAGNVLTYELRDGGPLDRALNEAGIIWDPLAAGAAASFTG